MNINFSSISISHLPGLTLFQNEWIEPRPLPGTTVTFEPGRDPIGFSIIPKEDETCVHYARPCDAYRALGLLRASSSDVKAFSQDCAHQFVGVMWDLSRNGVLHLKAWEQLLRKFALFGINVVQLYMEDVYQIPGEPFFGYARGAYSQAELRKIDEYGTLLGIEVIPCIQTLGHLEQIHQWPAFADTVDVHGVLLVDEEKTRELIGKMLDQMAASFRSRKIHVGMDEAHGVGTGNYLRRHGYKRPFDILSRHLKMVSEMCRERGLQPMIWSDMYFRIGSKTNDYYDPSSVIPPDIIEQVPADVELVYWDYEHSDSAFYEEWIRRHRSLGKEPIFAAGAASWGRFWAFAPMWRENLDAGMQAARNQRLSHTLLTVWGDDGSEFHPASVLPAVQYFAEWAYAGLPSPSRLERQFPALSSEANLSDYLRASQLDDIPAVQGIPESFPNFSKWILWHDPVLGFLNAHLTPNLSQHYQQLAQKLEGSPDEAIQFAALLATALASKVELHLGARRAYLARNFEEIQYLRDEVVPTCIANVHHLWSAHQSVWEKWRKPFGWEVIDRRYAGCVARIERLGCILEKCAQHPSEPILEWEIEPLIIKEPSKSYFSYHRVATPSEQR